jgi:hypothetical protein
MLPAAPIEGIAFEAGLTGELGHAGESGAECSVQGLGVWA